MGTGQELWKKAKTIIPGGSQLLSKRSEMFLPDFWPSYYSKAKGINVWDLDGNKLIDMSIMGIGSCILGYADDDVDNAVKKRIDAGSMCTLNSPEEVTLAEKLLKLNPWAGGVRYARTGGESMAIAIRIARAASKKGVVAFSGYHGWHDWYLSSNILNGNNLDAHLLKGLKPLGVPKDLEATSLPFHYNRIDELEAIIDKHGSELGVICVEAIRSEKPKDDFLNKVRQLADSIGAVLIFDEITSAFRISIGGMYKNFSVEPDIAVFGKAMSNGYPMAAVVGKAEIMNVAQDSFISSTYWTEGIGPTAALATIAKMEQHNVPQHIHKIGTATLALWKKLGQEHGMKMHVDDGSFPAIVHFGFDYENAQAVRTLFTQEMLARHYLASNGLYVSYSHQKEDLDKYGEVAGDVFGILKKAVDSGTVEKQLRGPVAHSGFQRLT